MSAPVRKYFQHICLHQLRNIVNIYVCTSWEILSEAFRKTSQHICPLQLGDTVSSSEILSTDVCSILKILLTNVCSY